MVNDNSLFIVGCAGINTTCATLLQVIINSGAQPIMIGKQHVQDLGLTIADLDPCQFTIVTLVGL